MRIIIYLNRARLYVTQFNEPAKAKADYEQIVLLDTVVKNQGNCRQYALMELGRNEEAIAWMNKIVETYPTGGNYYDATCLYSKMNKTNQSLSTLKLAFENGFRDITHLLADDDTENVSKLPDFKNLVEEWKTILKKEEKKEFDKNKTETNISQQTVVIQLKEEWSGIYQVACKINELPLNFILDSGSSDISISQTEIQFMLKNNYLLKSDILGSQSYSDANGDIEVGTKIMLKKVEIGDFVLRNVAASVVNNNKAPLLFGQSALGKYGRFTIDNKAKTITIQNLNK